MDESNTIERAMRVGRRLGKTVVTTKLMRAMVDPAGAEALAAAEAKRERKAAKRERDAARQAAAAVARAR